MSRFDERKTQDLDHNRRGGIVAALRNVSTSETFTLALGRQRWLVGSGESCDLTLADPYISGIHAVLERRADGSLLLRDRESRNGTFIDGNEIEAADLRVGSHLTLGRTTLIATAATAGAGDKPRAYELIKGRDAATRLVVEQAVRAAQTDCSVLVVGETGTGKDLIARLVHESSRRSSGPFVAVNCGAISRDLIGSELFGHEKGAFTGATESRDGYFVEAHGGTLFLDEIGELPLEMQTTLLRALETRRVRRIGGGATERSVDVRIVAATNRLEGLGTEQSSLRLDLYHRIATMVLALPPLRERMDDLVDIVHAVLDEYAPQYGQKTVTPEAWHVLTAYDWPGNIRELRHAVARAIALGGSDLGPLDFFPQFQIHGLRFPTETMDGGSLVPYQAMLRGAMESALRVHGTIRAAALSLGMPKSTFADKARQWGLITRRRRTTRNSHE